MDKFILFFGMVALCMVVILTMTLSSFTFDLCLPFNGTEHNGETFSGYVGWCK